MYTSRAIENDDIIDNGGLQKKACNIPSITPNSTLLQYIMVSGLNPILPTILRIG
ncbi:MAG: hypothetical protein QXJ72_03555 [Thermoproteota archaeon]